MKTDEGVCRPTEVIMRKHPSLATERNYCAWLRRCCDDLKGFPFHFPSEHKPERFLTALAGRMPPQELKFKPLTQLFFPDSGSRRDGFDAREGRFLDRCPKLRFRALLSCPKANGRLHYSHETVTEQPAGVSGRAARLPGELPGGHELGHAAAGGLTLQVGD